MKSTINNFLLVAALSAGFAACTKNEDVSNGAANTASAAAANLSLNNRVVAAFVKDSSTLPNLPAGTLPAGYNNFRKLLTYDTSATVNKAPAYNVGDVINIAAYLKGDDFAISKRKINFRFFQPPASFITATALFPLQKAEDSYRGFAPGVSDILNTVSFPFIGATSTAPFEVKIVDSEKTGGINYSTYLVQLAYTIPQALSGKVVSINFTANTAGTASDLGNVNWIYAFRVK